MPLFHMHVAVAQAGHEETAFRLDDLRLGADGVRGIGPHIGEAPAVTAMSVPGMISPEWTFTQRPLRITMSALVRPMAVSIRGRKVSAQLFSAVIGNSVRWPHYRGGPPFRNQADMMASASSRSSREPAVITFTALHDVAACPLRRETAGTGDDGQEGVDVIRLQAAIHGDVHVAGRHHAEEIGISAIAGELGPGLQLLEAALVLFAAIEFGRGGAHKSA